MPEENILYCKKDHWKKEVAPSEVKMQMFLEAAQWAQSTAKITEFWITFEEEKIKKKDYDFSNVVFPPSFHKGSFLDQGKTPFEGDVSFKNAHFLGSVTFRKERFLGKADFSHTVFKGPAYFDQSVFESDLIFEYAIFEKKIQFQGEFYHKVTFKKCEYYQHISFLNASFKDQFLFQENFSVDLSLFKNYSYRLILALVNLLRPTGDYSTENLKKNIDRIEAFKNPNIREVKILVKQVLKEKYYNLNAELSFDLVEFGSNSIIKRVILNNASFIGTSLDEVKFIACGWNDSKRLIIRDEKLIRQFGYKNYNLRQKNIELSYRQLRHNFEKQKDWELSGKAYQSEMVHRKNRLLSEGSLIDYCFYSVYHFFGFNYNIAVPFKILLFNTFLLFPVLYFEVADLLFWNGMKSSFANTLPFIKFEVTEAFYNMSALWWISSSQSLASLVAITFLILSLRNRFR